MLQRRCGLAAMDEVASGGGLHRLEDFGTRLPYRFHFIFSLVSLIVNPEFIYTFF